MINLDSVSIETFQILRSFDFTLALYDDAGNIVSEPEEARRMFASPKNLLVSIVDDNDNSTLRLYISKSTRLKKDSKMRRLIQTLRTCASKYNMMFKVRRHSKELKPKDFATRASVNEGKEYMTELTEGLYGTSRRSYLAMENAKMIIRHKGKINEEVSGARSRMIESILVENSRGERFLMPTTQLAPARAMTQHVNQGGGWADEVGSHILRMGQAFDEIRTCSNFIGTNQTALAEGAMEIREKCMGKRKEMRRSFARLAKESTYADECNALKEHFGGETLVEAAVLENLREMLFVEGKELDESVLNTVASFIGETEDRMLDEDDMRDVAPKPGDNSHETGVRHRVEGTVTILGHPIPEHVWKDMSKDDAPRRLELRAPPKFGHMPDFSSKSSEIMYKLTHVAPLVKDDATSNLLADVVEKFQSTPVSDATRRGLYLKLAITALQAANVKLNEELGPRAVDAILEHEAWFAQFDPTKVLLEASEEDCPPDCGDEELSEDRDEEKLDENFMSSVFGKSKGQTITKRVNGYVYKIEHLGGVVTRITQKGPEGVKDIPLSHPLAKTLAAKSGLRTEGNHRPRFLENEDMNDEVLDEEFEDNDLDAEFFEEDADPIDANVGNDCQIDETEELTREDVLLPKDPGLDLAREVSAGKDDDEDETILDESPIGAIGRVAAKAAVSAVAHAAAEEIAKKGVQYYRNKKDAGKIDESLDAESRRIIELSKRL